MSDGIPTWINSSELLLGGFTRLTGSFQNENNIINANITTTPNNRNQSTRSRPIISLRCGIGSDMTEPSNSLESKPSPPAEVGKTEILI